MRHLITGRWNGKRSNGVVCTITEVAEYDRTELTALPPRGTYLLVDQEPIERLAKGRYQVLLSRELVTSDDPDAP